MGRGRRPPAARHARTTRPAIGRGGPDGVVWATGHYRNGILLAPVTADAVAASLAGEDPPAEVAVRPGRFAARRTRSAA